MQPIGTSLDELHRTRWALIAGFADCNKPVRPAEDPDLQHVTAFAWTMSGVFSSPGSLSCGGPTRARPWWRQYPRRSRGVAEPVPLSRGGAAVVGRAFARTAFSATSAGEVMLDG